MTRTANDYRCDFQSGAIITFACSLQQPNLTIKMKPDFDTPLQLIDHNVASRTVIYLIKDSPIRMWRGTGCLWSSDLRTCLRSITHSIVDRRVIITVIQRIARALPRNYAFKCVFANSVAGANRWFYRWEKEILENLISRESALFHREECHFIEIL